MKSFSEHIGRMTPTSQHFARFSKKDLATVMMLGVYFYPKEIR